MLINWGKTTTPLGDIFEVDVPLLEGFCPLHNRVAGVGWLSGSATKSLGAFVERVFANFCDKNVVFYN